MPIKVQKLILMATCRSCGLYLPNIMQLGAHRRICQGLDHDSSDGSFEHSGSAADDDRLQIQTPAFVIGEASFAPPDQTTPLHQLARRAKGKHVPESGLSLTVEEIERTERGGNQSNRTLARRFTPLQKMWDVFVEKCYSTCCPSFWKVHSAVRHQSGTCRDAVFDTVFSLIPGALKTGLAWPRSSRFCLKVCFTY